MAFYLSKEKFVINKSFGHLYNINVSCKYYESKFQQIISNEKLLFKNKFGDRYNKNIKFAYKLGKWLKEIDLNEDGGE